MRATSPSKYEQLTIPEHPDSTQGYGINGDGRTDFGNPFERSEADSRQFYVTAGKMALTIVTRDPRAEGVDAIVSVPDRATEMGQVVADILGLPHVPMGLYKAGGFYLPTDVDKTVKSAAIVDTLFRDDRDTSELAALLDEVGIDVGQIVVASNVSGHRTPSTQAGLVRVPVNALQHQPVLVNRIRV